MRWNRTNPRPQEKGEYLIAFHNTANGMCFLKHIEIDANGLWIEPGTDLMAGCFGKHLQIVASVKLKFPK